MNIINKIKNLREKLNDHGGKNEEAKRNEIIAREKKMLEASSGRYVFQDVNFNGKKHVVEMVDKSYTTGRNSEFSAGGDNVDVQFMQMRVFDLNGDVVMGALIERQKISGTKDFGKVRARVGTQVDRQWQEVETYCEDWGWKAFEKAASEMENKEASCGEKIDAFLRKNQKAKMFFEGNGAPTKQREM